MSDIVNHPDHYNSHPSGVEVIRITEWMNFCLGNAVKYILRADHKGDALTDLHKAEWYIKREIARREGEMQQQGMDALFASGDVQVLMHMGIPTDLGKSKNWTWLDESLDGQGAE